MQSVPVSENSNGTTTDAFDSLVKKVVKEKEEIGIIEEDEDDDDEEEEVVMIEEDDDDSENEEEEEEEEEKTKKKEEKETKKNKEEETKQNKVKKKKNKEKENKQSKNKNSLLQNGKTNGTSKRSYTKDKKKKTTTTTTKENEKPIKKKRRWRRNTVALRRIMRFQRMTKKHFPFAIADRMVRRIGGEFQTEKLQLARGTVDMIREVIEANIVEAIKCCVLIRANCNNQVLLTKQDLDLYKEIRYKKRFSDSS